VLYTFRHRDFTCMKVIYLLPAIIPFAFVFANECERFFDWLRRHHSLRVGTWISLGALLLVYATDTLVLVGHLAGLSPDAPALALALAEQCQAVADREEYAVDAVV